MALTTPVALTAVASGAAATLVSASYTPTANGIQFVYIAATGSVNGETLTGVSSTHSGTGTWTIVKFQPSALSKCLAAVAWAITGPSPGSGTFTASFTSASADNELLVCETTGQDAVTPVNGQDAQGDAVTSTTPVLTLSVAPTTDDLTVVCFGGRNIGAAPSVPSGTDTFTSLGSNTHASPCAAFMGSYRLSSTSTGITPAGMGTVANAGAAIVIKAAAASGVAGATVPSATPGRTWQRRFKHRQTPQTAGGSIYVGDTSTALTFSATSAATRTTLGDVSTALTFSATANANTTKLADVAAPLTFTATADTTRTTLGQASATFTFAATADATVTHAGITADVSSTFTFGATAGAAALPGNVSTALTFSATADAGRTTLGQASTALTFSATAASTRTTLGQASTALTFGATAAATRTTLGQAAATFAFGATADSARTTLGQASAPFTLAFTAAATVTSGGGITPGRMTSTAGTGPGMTAATSAGGMTASSPAGPGMSGASFPSGMTATTGTTSTMSGG